MARTLTPLTPLVLLLLGACEGATEPAPLMTELPRALTSTERTVIEASNQFAFDLLRETAAAETAENLVLSPLSVSMAMGMAMNGAAGQTWDGMRAGLRFGGLEQEEINASYRGLIDLLLDLDPGTRSRIVNSVWYRDGFAIEDAFADAVRSSFDAEVQPLDFDSPTAPDRINQWVDRATEGRITSVLDGINPEDILFLVNAVHFKGQWRNGFDPAMTRDDRFVRADGSAVPIRMMSRNGAFASSRGPGYRAAELPYGNGAFAMTVVLPAEGGSIGDLVAGLDAEGWDDLVRGLVESTAVVELPRFTVEYAKTLNDALSAMGMHQAFSPGGADFSRLSADHGRQLYISEVLHKTLIEVDEVGTEAAAATKVTIGLVSMPPVFRVDQPFLFAIRERLSGTILFLGVIGDP